MAREKSEYSLLLEQAYSNNNELKWVDFEKILIEKGIINNETTSEAKKKLSGKFYNTLSFLKYRNSVKLERPMDYTEAFNFLKKSYPDMNREQIMEKNKELQDAIDILEAFGGSSQAKILIQTATNCFAQLDAAKALIENYNM